MAQRRIKAPQLGTDLVKVYFDSDVQEYSVRVTGNPAATYYTDDKQDAMSTAQLMHNTLLGA